MATNPNRRPTRAALALDDLFITTLDQRRKGIVDVTFHKNPFFFWLSSKGQMEGLAGGREIVVDLEVGENDTVKSFGKGETFSLAEQEIFTEAHYKWKQLGGSLVRYATDDAKNAGRSAYIRMAEARIKNLEKSLRKELEVQLMGDGTGNNSKDTNGLKNLITIAGTGTVGEIISGTYTWWKNHFKSSSGAASVYLLPDLRNLFLTIGGDDQDFTDFNITDQTTYELYDDEALEQKQIVNKTLADADFEHLIFRGTPIVYLSRCTDGYWYMINSEYIKFYYNKFMNFMTTEWKEMVNSADRAMQIMIMCNLAMSHRRKHGVLYGVEA